MDNESKKEIIEDEESVIKKTRKKGRKFVKDFFGFIQRGNVIDLAVGIVVGGAFQKIISSLVNDIIMPLLSLIGKQNLSDAKLILREAVMEGDVVVKAEAALLWGSFVQAIIDFLIIAFAIFVAIRAMGAFRSSLDKRAKVIVEKVKELKEDE
jgi:large conductance mechanosensitive channel